MGTAISPAGKKSATKDLAEIELRLKELTKPSAPKPDRKDAVSEEIKEVIKEIGNLVSKNGHGTSGKKSGASQNAHHQRLVKTAISGLLKKTKADIRAYKWNSALKVIDEAISFSDKKVNKLVSVSKADLIVIKARVLYLEKGNMPSVRKLLKDALRSHPKNPKITYELARLEILNANSAGAFALINTLPRKSASGMDTILRHMLQPHTEHGGLDVTHPNGRRGFPGDPDEPGGHPFGPDGDPYGPEPGPDDGPMPPGGTGPGGFVEPGSVLDNLENGRLPGGTLSDLPLDVLSDGKPIGFPCNFYTYHYTLFEDADLQHNLERYGDVDDVASIDTTSPEYQFRVYHRVFKNWNLALSYLHTRNYSAAIESLNKAQSDAFRILLRSTRSAKSNSWGIGDVPPLESTIEEAQMEVLRYKFRAKASRKNVYEANHFRTILSDRSRFLDLDSLYIFDWLSPRKRHNADNQNMFYVNCGLISNPFYNSLWGAAKDNIPADNLGVGYINGFNVIELRRRCLDFPLLMLANLFIPFAKIESYRFSKQYDRALKEIDRIFFINDDRKGSKKGGKNKLTVPGFHLLNPVIERPFLKILKSQVLMELADNQYKTGETTSGTDKVENPNKLLAYRTYNRAIEVFDEWAVYSANSQAAITVFNDQREALLKNAAGEYKAVNSMAVRERRRLGETLLSTDIIQDAERKQAQAYNKQVWIPGVASVFSGRIALRPTKNHPWQRLLKWDEAGKENAQSNPVIYAIILEANARLLQIKNSLNYLGYRDNFVPPWKFSYLMDRARYYCDQAKNLQRDYLNFINNAENQQFQELTAGQAISLERMNLNVENAKVDQASEELEVSVMGAELAQLQSRNAVQRKANYEQYDRVADNCDKVAAAGICLSGIGGIAVAVVSALGGGAAGAAGGAIVAAPTGETAAPATIPAGAAAGLTVGGIVGILGASAMGIGGVMTGLAQLYKEGEQREMEKKNLALSVEEADKARQVAAEQIDVAEAGLAVANLQAQTSLMRLEFARDNYEYLRNRLTNAEMWFRLAHSIREIAKIYMKRAIEMSFLAEQAYEFMIDRQINVIRFDYDNDQLGDMLGADYLKSDLDYLESHLIFTQKEKQQQVKAVISLARDFPQALQELTNNESVILSIPLQYWEQRFPGLYDIKISAVELQPIAVMDPTRFCVDLTFLGTGNIRVKNYPVDGDGSDGTSIHDFDYGTQSTPWIPAANELYPVKVLVRQVETSIISGLTSADESTYFQSFSSSQKNAFEDCPAAAGWRIDMGQAENRMVRGTLADVLITFYVTGYYDQQLKDMVDEAMTTGTNSVNKILSARNSFPDQLFNFHRTGTITFPVKFDMLSINERVNELKQLGIYMMPAANNYSFSRFAAVDLTEFQLGPGTITINRTPPCFRLEKVPGTDTKAVRLIIKGLAGRTFRVFNDENDQLIPVIDLTPVVSDFKKAEILYTKQGKHSLKVQVVTNGELDEYKFELYVSDSADPILPVTVFPELSFESGTDVVARLKIINSSYNMVNAADTMNATIICINEQGKEVFQFTTVDGHGGAPAKTFRTDIGAYLTERNLNGDPNEKYFLVCLFTQPLSVQFESLQRNTRRSTPFAATGNKLTTNIDATTVADRNEFTLHLVGNAGTPETLSPLDRWTFELPLATNVFTTAYDCNGNVVQDCTMFQDAALMMEYATKRRLGY